MKVSTFFISMFVVFLLVGCERAEDPPPPQTAAPEAPAAPETAPAAKAPADEQRPAEQLPTASDQPATEADVKIVQQIRQAVVQDDALSTRAQNVTIVSEEGRVTLRGTVNDQTEKEIIAARAQQVQGVREIDNELVIAQ